MESALTKSDVWIVADAIISPLGFTSEENFQNVCNDRSGLKNISDASLSSFPIHAGQVNLSHTEKGFTRFEQMCVNAISRIVEHIKIPIDKTLFILSTTKGNINLLKTDPAHPRIHLHATAKHIAKHFGIENTMVVSNACISGVMAITVAKRFMQTGQYDHALVVGADELTSFVVSGFQSLGALSPERCRPFDKSRIGINLGEAAAAVLLTSKPELLSEQPTIKVLGSGLTNDANHISGPSRTGEELALAINTALTESKLDPQTIDFISAHGTATLYNDEMEAKAFNLARLSETPLNSLKGYYGHTLGAAGVLELIISLHALRNDQLVTSLGYEESGVSQQVNVVRNSSRANLKTLLKTASGFGGCNAAIVLQKHT